MSVYRQRKKGSDKWREANMIIIRINIHDDFDVGLYYKTDDEHFL